MKAIVNVDENWGIGCGGSLLFPIPEDMKFFRETTSGKVVVMGRKTLESFPGAAPLKNRVNILFSRTPGLVVPGATVVGDIPQLRSALAGCPPEEVYVIGGQAVYHLLLGYCSTALVTRVQARGKADTFFPNLDTNPNWQLTLQSETKEHEGTRFTFCTYQNHNPKAL